MSGVYLFLWVAVTSTVTGNPYANKLVYKWKNAGVFIDAESCKNAATTLGIKEFRCVSNRTGK